MNIKTFSILFGSLLSAVFLFASCQEEEETPYIPGAYSWDFGYVKGQLNETYIFLQNEGGREGEHISASGTLYGKTTMPDGTYTDYYCTTIPITKGQDILTYGFAIKISPVKTGLYEIAPPSMNTFECNLSFIDKRDADSEKTYMPLKEPVRLLIHRAEFTENAQPFIEGTMDGVLYNPQNMKDSIVIKSMEFGVHY